MQKPKMNICFYLLLFLKIFSEFKDAEAIVGGRNTGRHELPYMVSIQYEGRHHCGGAIVTRKHVISAARCAFYKEATSSYKIFSGINKLDDPTGLISAVSMIWIDNMFAYPESKRRDLLPYYDIAIFLLEEPLTFSRTTMPVLITSIAAPKKETRCLVSGWGANACSLGVTTIHNSLKGISVYIPSQNKCKRMVPSKWRTMNESHLCVQHFRLIGDTGFGACGERDEGAPLICNDKLTGIYSKQVHCGTEKPEIFASIHASWSFIRRMIGVPELEYSRDWLEKNYYNKTSM